MRRVPRSAHNGAVAAAHPYVANRGRRGQHLHLPMLSAPAEFCTTVPLPLPPYRVGQLLANGGMTGSTAIIYSNSLDAYAVQAPLPTADGVKISKTAV